MRQAIDAAKRVALANFRRGQPEVLWTPPKLRLGNYLYFWLRAWQNQRDGHDYRVLADASMQSWTVQFPSIAPLLISPREVRFRYLRETVNQTYFQAFGQDFSDSAMTNFVREVVLTSQTMQRAIQHSNAHPNDLVINVRRGDYYTVPKFRGMYGFDISTYLQVALTQQNTSFGEPQRIIVVSDGPEWCRSRLNWLNAYAPTEFRVTRGNPLGDLATIIGASRLILTNTTFGFWGAYINGVHQDHDRRRISAPDFFDRSTNSGKPWQLDPRWSIITEVPDGWNA